MAHSFSGRRHRCLSSALKVKLLKIALILRYCEEAMHYMHDVLYMEWAWVAIAAPMLVRLATLPLTIASERFAAKRELLDGRIADKVHRRFSQRRILACLAVA